VRGADFDFGSDKAQHAADVGFDPPPMAGVRALLKMKDLSAISFSKSVWPIDWPSPAGRGGNPGIPRSRPERERIRRASTALTVPSAIL
jgi:hypothetical protein